MDELARLVMEAGAAVREHAPSFPELDTACRHGRDSEVRVVVLGPFNQGKSTLLNAVLGGRALPVDIVRSTAGPIVVRHGPAPRTRVVLADGTEVAGPGFGLLQTHCVLDGGGAPREPVREAEIRLPHPLLARGMALVDLPGTGDTPGQDAVIRRELLRADLVVQVLNARQLLTLDERRHLDDWVIGRGIGAVLFAVNFLNLLDAADQEAAWARAAALAARVETALPPGPRVLRVDALPALRASLKDDAEAMAASGLTAFRNHIAAVADDARRRHDLYRGPRVAQLARQVAAELSASRGELDQAARALRARHEAGHAAKRARLERLAQTLNDGAARARAALAAAELQRIFAAPLEGALRGGGFAGWRDRTLSPWLQSQVAGINAVAAEAGGAAGETRLAIVPAAQPAVTLPPAPSAGDGGGMAANVIGGAVIGFVGGSVVPILGHVMGPIAGILAGIGRAEEQKEQAARARREHEAAVGLAYRGAAERWLAGLGGSAVAAVDTFVAQLTASLAPQPARLSGNEEGMERKVAELDSFLARLGSIRAPSPARAA